MPPLEEPGVLVVTFGYGASAEGRCRTQLMLLANYAVVTSTLPIAKNNSTIANTTLPHEQQVYIRPKSVPEATVAWISRG